MAKVRKEVPDLVGSIDPDTIRVHAPTNVVFLCGGAMGDAEQPPKMLRDAFFRLSERRRPQYAIILAEDAEPLTVAAGYGDLLSFESDIAQVAGLIVLFVESPGSLAELGAFAALKTVAPSLLAVLSEYHYSQISFVKNGPVKFLEDKYGDEWIVSLDADDVATEGGQITSIDDEVFYSTVESVISERLRKLPRYAKLDKESSGHVILCITGLCQEYGALMENEIRAFLKTLGISDERLKNLLYCAELLGWIKRIRKGHQVFYVGRTTSSALDFNMKKDVPQKDKIRWRTDIRAFWREQERSRTKAISDAADTVQAVDTVE